MLKWYKKEITKEQYERATKDHDASGIFFDSEIWGYGVYCPKYTEVDGKYYVDYQLGSHCD